MMYDTLAIIFITYLLGVVSSLLLVRYGFNLGSKTLYQQKQNLPPEGVDNVLMEQSNTYEADEFEG